MPKKSIHVFTPLVTIQPNDQYVVKGYINLDKNSKVSDCISMNTMPGQLD